MRIHVSDGSLLYQCCAFVKHMVAQDAATRARALEAGALEAVVGAMAAHPRLVVLQGVGCWAVWLLLGLGPAPLEPEPEAVDRPASAAMSFNSVSSYSAYSQSGSVRQLTNGPGEQEQGGLTAPLGLGMELELLPEEPEPESQPEAGEDTEVAPQLEDAERSPGGTLNPDAPRRITFDMGPMGVKWNYPSVPTAGPFTLAFVAEALPAAAAGLVEGMRLMAMNGLSMRELRAEGFDNASIIDKMVRTRPLTLTLQMLPPDTPADDGNTSGEASPRRAISLGHMAVAHVPGMHVMPDEDNPPLDMCVLQPSFTYSPLV